ncbi:hypothetical protein FB567DRAFT_617487 [Paraphoma chrysanthemicola]|uniref:PRP38-assoc multi-domain protein n=1 Tax=Paraphoma chrysanthemicola TaxID=798071 RepID=A0A8K0R9Z0_9PLEO|nr:hypothetical protein FB567DRAFT_617487 [Paraphoma chrysanthemicola]
MSVLAFKAIGYGAEQIPDKFFEKIPGGFFTPAEKKKIDDGRDKKARERHQSEQRSKHSSRRDHSPQTDSSDHSGYDDTDYEHERDRRKKDRRRRAKSVGRSSSRSLSRGRNYRRSSDLDGQHSDTRDMAQAEQGGPYFPPPPTSDYRPYNPLDYAAGRPQGDYRPSSAEQPYYPPQVNHFSRSRSATFPSMAAYSTPVHGSPLARPPMFSSRPPSNLSTPLSPQPPMPHLLRHGTPISAAFTPSTEPPLAALFSRPRTNTPKQPAHNSSTASRYTPGPGYAPSAPVNTNIPAPPAGNTSPYVPYNPADYGSPAGGYQAAGNAYPSPPPFSRHRSNSQPASPPYPTSSYLPSSADQRMTAYDSTNQPPGRRSSTKHRREHRHRARSADTHSSRRDDRHREGSRMTKMRERFDDGFLRDEGLAATVGGAAAGALGGKAIADKRSKSRGAPRSGSRDRSRSRSRHRQTDRARSRGGSRERSPPRGIRARSKSIIDRFRSKSRGPESRDRSRDRSRDVSRDRYSRPDHGYERGRDDDYDYFSSESEGTGSPVKTRRHRKRRDY